jgi:hypothetical protein
MFFNLINGSILKFKFKFRYRFIFSDAPDSYLRVYVDIVLRGSLRSLNSSE